MAVVKELWEAREVEDRRRKEEGSRSSKPPEVGESGISIGGKGDIDGKARPEGSRAMAG